MREVLREAARRRAPLWPVSRGCNWGYGSHLPARDGTVVLDLSELKAISDLDRASLSVRIEPGVTQGALYAFLQAQAPDLTFNVTGAGLETSVLGNALERGIGYSGEKDQDVYGLEVLLADGSQVGPVAGRHHRSRGHPAGLSLDPLFFQTSLGIVLGGRLRLRVRQEAEEVVVFQGSFPEVIASLKRFYDHGLLRDPAHLAAPGRSQRLGFGLLRELWKRDPSPEEVNRCFPEQNTYSGIVPLCGRRRVVRAQWGEMRRLAVEGVGLRRVSPGMLGFASRWLSRLGLRYQAARLRALRPLLSLCWGEPSDIGLVALDGFSGGNPDRASRGALYGNAVTAVDPLESQKGADIVRRHWKDSAFTWAVLDSRCMITVYTLHFGDAEREAAHSANQNIIAELRQAGLAQYRLNGDTPSAPGSDSVGRLIKGALDPDGLIAPGKYGL